MRKMSWMPGMAMLAACLSMAGCVLTFRTVPDVAGQTQSAAQAAVRTAMLTVGTVTTGCSNTVAVGSVVSQSPAAPGPARYGSAVNLVVSGGPCPSLVITSPNGGETWTQGQTYAITWNASSVPGDVGVHLSENGADTLWLGLAAATAGQLSWTIPTFVTPGNAYRIHVTSANKELVEDLSDNAFTIVSPPSPLTVTSPNGGETWTQGKTYTITWNETGVSGDVSVHLNVNGADTYWLGGVSASAGQFSWTVPYSVTPGSAYRVHVTSADNGAIEDLSDGTFIIAPTSAALTVTSPNGGETWTQGQTYAVTWNQADVTGEVGVQLSENGADIVWIGSAAASAGQLSWTIPASVTPGSAYRIHLISADINTVTDLSDNTFTIVPAPPPLTVTSPNGGETWTQDQTYPVTWNSIGVTGDVSVYLSANGADTLWIGGVSAAAGQLSWRVPISVTPGGGYRIHVISAANSAVGDLSDGTFTIAPTTASLSVTSPNGGETWTQGQTYTVTWNETDVTGEVGVHLSVNGTDLVWIGRAAAATGQLSWTIPASLTPGGAYRMHVISADNNVIEDLSDNTFTIVPPPPPLTVISPNGGETWTQGQTCAVTWNAIGVTGDVAVYLRENGADILWLGAASASAGQLAWTIPVSVTPGSAYRMHVISADNNEIGDLSDGAFTIAPTTASLHVTSPNGGETWMQGQTYAITWNQAGVTGGVDVQLSQNGADVLWLGTAAAADGQLAWTIPVSVTPGSAYRIHVVSADNNAIEDLSDNTFSIVPGASPLAVTSPNGGETWTQGQTYAITWNAAGVTGEVAVYLNENGVDTNWLGGVLASAGQLSWTVPASVTPGGAYRIHVTSADNNTIEDLSDGTFTIAATTATLTVTSPNGGETWAQGQSHPITWSQTGVTGDVAVFLSVGGADVLWLGAAAAADGQMAWAVPIWLDAGSAYKVHVISAVNNTVEDLSDGAFTITP